MKVNSEIRRIIREKDLMIKSGTKAMLGILKELQKQVLVELGTAAIGSWDAHYLKSLLSTLEWQISNYTLKLKAEAAGQLDAAWGKGQFLVDDPLALDGFTMGGFNLSTSMLDTLKDFTFHRMENLTDSAWARIRAELTMGILGGKTPAEVATAIGKNLSSGHFKNIAYRAEMITKTEMGRVFSTAAQLRMDQAAEHVEGLEKQWLHAGHPKIPRTAHVAAHGQHVPVKAKFNIGGVMMLHPRDPGAPLEEVMNCG